MPMQSYRFYTVREALLERRGGHMSIYVDGPQGGAGITLSDQLALDLALRMLDCYVDDLAAEDLAE